MRAAVVTNRSWDFQFHLEKVAVMDVETWPQRRYSSGPLSVTDVLGMFLEIMF
jgi:hypothetical protein